MTTKNSPNGEFCVVSVTSKILYTGEMNKRISTLLRMLLIITLVVLVLLAVVVYSYLAPGPAVPGNPLYRNSSASIDDRVNNLMSYMTLREKIGQMALVEKNSLEELADLQTYGIGGMLSGFGGRPEENTQAGWYDMVTEFVSTSKQSRLGIPVLYGVDAIHGHSNVLGATIFPHTIGLGATGDTELVRRVAEATAKEMIATNIHWSYSPTLDMPEDIRWGRAYETFSDDPALVSRLGTAYLQGLQGAERGRPQLLATPKHYIGLGGMVFDTSSNKNFRIDQGMTPQDESRLRTHYLPPFKEAVDAGALSVMVGLNTWGDTKLAASSYLMQTVLKDELGFEGFLVSDWYGVYEIPGGDFRAAITAINAGVDMVMLPFDYEQFTQNVWVATKLGLIDEARIDDAVKRILKAKFAVGLFDEPATTSAEVFGSDEHRAIAREAVAKSLVLLKNDNNLLPLKPGTSIKVAGSAADNIGRQSGAWTIEWQGIDGNWLPGATSILAGLQAVAPRDTTIEYSLTGEFPTAEKADIGIAVVGEAPYAEGWGDTPEPKLSEEDIAAIARLREQSEKVVVVLVTGRPLMVSELVADWDAVVVAWLPGSEGAGVADGLFGATPFTGTLPLPWPASVSQLPIVNNQTANGTIPLFPRYFGLK